MTTIAIVVGSVFAYVVVAGRVCRHYRDNSRIGYAGEEFIFAALWPVYAAVLLVIRSFVFAWNLGARRRSKLPEARVRR